MIVTILLGVVSLAVLVLAFVASKYWHWAQVTVLVLFYFACVGYGALAARSLDTRLEHQKRLYDAQKQLTQQAELYDGLLRGSTDPKIVNRLASSGTLAAEGGNSIDGATQLEHRLRMANRQRGRIWRNAQPAGTAGAGGYQVNVEFPVAAPTNGNDLDGAFPEQSEPQGPPPALGLEPDSIVYVFEQGPLEGSEQMAPRHYLGEFRVESVEGRQAVLDALDQLELDDHATERLINSRGPWIIYESMPADSRDLFAGLDEETLRKLLPASVIEEYVRDGTPATPDDPPARLQGVDADGNLVPPDAEDKAVAKQYRRRLRDYAMLLADLEANRAELIAREQAITSDIAKLEAALKGAEEIREYREEEITKWRHDLAAVERERKAIEAHASTLQSQVDKATRLLEATLRENAQLAQVRASKRGVLTPMGSGALDVDAL